MVEGYRKINWTEHSKIKMRQYGLSKNKLINLVYKPERKEAGIVPNTTAVMKTNKTYSVEKKVAFAKASASRRKVPGEIWVMYQDIKNKNIRKIISAWRYPGVSKPGETADIIAKYSD